MVRLLLTVSLLCCSSAVFAQSKERLLDRTATLLPAGNPIFELDFQLRPTIGRDMPFEDENPYIDDASGSLGLRMVVPISRRAKLSLTPGVTVSPNFLDDDSPTTGWFTQFRLEANQPIGTHHYGHADAPELRDTLTPYVQYRVESGYQDFLDQHKQTDHAFSAGLAFEDIRYVLCRNASNCSERFDTGEGLTKGLRYKLAAELGRILSTDAARERLTPMVSARLLVPTARILTFYLNAKAESRRYSSARISTGRKLHENRLTFEAGVDFTGTFGLPKGVELSAGVQYVRNRSNDDGKDWNRGFLVPALTISRVLH